VILPAVALVMLLAAFARRKAGAAVVRAPAELGDFAPTLPGLQQADYRYRDPYEFSGKPRQIPGQLPPKKWPALTDSPYFPDLMPNLGPQSEGWKLVYPLPKGFDPFSGVLPLHWKYETALQFDAFTPAAAIQGEVTGAQLRAVFESFMDWKTLAVYESREALPADWPWPKSTDAPGRFWVQGIPERVSMDNARPKQVTYLFMRHAWLV
jgi:hypothetical protein